jgi:hypothetical protein
MYSVYQTFRRGLPAALLLASLGATGCTWLEAPETSTGTPRGDDPGDL